jgi:protein-S-isoprenylcysteine O-methyltransferase Ste14
MIRRLLVQLALWLAFLAVLLAGAAGTLRWTAGWVFLAEWAVLSLWLGLWLARRDPALLAERLAPVLQRQQSRWDRGFIVCTGVLGLAWMILMGLDGGRYRWSGMPLALQGLGAVGVFASVWLCRFVFAANSFAAPVVKIQRERGHRVIDSGPYARVRHPMYAAALPFFAGLPLLLGSWWGLAAAPLLVAGLAWRAVREERVLAAQLDGYAAYLARVRYRFVPHVW